jgi:hypothetical protein
LAAEGFEDLVHLLFGGFEGAGIVDHKVCGFNFFLVWDLSGHTPCDFGASGVFGDMLAPGKALDALLGLAGNDNQMIESIGGVGFEDKRRFHDGDGIGIALADFFYPLVFVADDGGMNDGIQFLNARQGG